MYEATCTHSARPRCRLPMLLKLRPDRAQLSGGLETQRRTSAASNDCRSGPADPHGLTLSAWARHAAASNGFADVDAGSLTPSHQSTELAAAALAFRSATFEGDPGGIEPASLQRSTRLYTSWRRCAVGAATHRALRLSTLARCMTSALIASEVRSVAHELTG